MDVLLPPSPETPIGWSPTAAGPTSSSMISAILGMTYAQIAALILSGGGCIWTTQLLPSTQVNTLASIPVQQVAAPGAGRVVQPVYTSTEQLNGVTPYSVAPALSGRYVGTAIADIPSDTLSNVASARVTFLEVTDAGSIGTGNNVTGLAYEMTAAADTTLGSGNVRLILGYTTTAGL
jgi:hypothetical protein